MDSAEAIKYLKETADRLSVVVGMLATYNAIFLSKNCKDEDEETKKSVDNKDRFKGELNSIISQTNELNKNIGILENKVGMIEKLTKK